MVLNRWRPKKGFFCHCKTAAWINLFQFGKVLGWRRVPFLLLIFITIFFDQLYRVLNYIFSFNKALRSKFWEQQQSWCFIILMAIWYMPFQWKNWCVVCYCFTRLPLQFLELCSLRLDFWRRQLFQNDAKVLSRAKSLTGKIEDWKPHVDDTAFLRRVSTIQYSRSTRCFAVLSFPVSQTFPWLSSQKVLVFPLP